MLYLMALALKAAVFNKKKNHQRVISTAELYQSGTETRLLWVGQSGYDYSDQINHLEDVK